MIRTLISIPEDDKNWLESFSRKNRQSVSETIRLAVRYLRTHFKKDSNKTILKDTAGIWKSKKIDSLAYVENLRNEWKDK